MLTAEEILSEPHDLKYIEKCSTQKLRWYIRMMEKECMRRNGVEFNDNRGTDW